MRVYREQGGAVNEHVAPDRRHVARTELRDWITKHYPHDRPPTLFDATDRATNTAIKTADFETLQADRDAARSELKKMAERARETVEKISTLQGERDSLASMVEKMNVPGARNETTYLNIIGGLLGLMLGKSPAGKQQSIFDNQSMVIAALLGNYSGRPGISDSNLEKYFADGHPNSPTCGHLKIPHPERGEMTN